MLLTFQQMTYMSTSLIVGFLEEAVCFAHSCQI